MEKLGTLAIRDRKEIAGVRVWDYEGDFLENYHVQVKRTTENIPSPSLRIPVPRENCV